jgi:Transposase IS116/IS110/IS902 family
VVEPNRCANAARLLRRISGECVVLLENSLSPRLALEIEVSSVSLAEHVVDTWQFTVEVVGVPDGVATCCWGAVFGRPECEAEGEHEVVVEARGCAVAVGAPLGGHASVGEEFVKQGFGVGHVFGDPDAALFQDEAGGGDQVAFGDVGLALFAADFASAGDRDRDQAAALAPGLLELPGCGGLTTAKLLCEIGPVDRFRSDSQLARHAGVAPLDASSGKHRRHRLDRGGNRQLNCALHRIAVTQGRVHPPAKAYLERKQAEGKTRREALRCLKRQLARTVYTTLKSQPLLTWEQHWPSRPSAVLPGEGLAAWASGVGREARFAALPWQ